MNSNNFDSAAVADPSQVERQRLLMEKQKRLEEIRTARQRTSMVGPRASDVRDNLRDANVGGAVLDLRRMAENLGIATVAPTSAATSSNHNLLNSGHTPRNISTPENDTYSLSNGSSSVGFAHFHNAALTTKKPSNLELSSVPPVSFPPKGESFTYSKTTQTDDDRISYNEFTMGSQEFAYEDDISLDDSQMLHITACFDESPSHEVRKHLKNLNFHHSTQQSQLETLVESQMTTKGPELSDEEKRKILNDNDFVRFFHKSARVMERALAEIDIHKDYISASSLADEKMDDGSGPDNKRRALLTQNRMIFEPRLVENRYVRAIDFSSFCPELFAVAYDKNPEEPSAPESIVLVWNTQFKTSPELAFHSSSRVTSMIFDSFQPNKVIGGCYSGQICVWDMRSNKRSPVCKTPLSQNSHTQPVYCMKMVGSMNAHELVTVSTDGRLCSWSLDNFQQPIEAMNLIVSPRVPQANTVAGRDSAALLSAAKHFKQVSPLCMSFFCNNINDFVVGTEDNELNMGDRHGAKGEITQSIMAHKMPVTAVDMHSAPAVDMHSGPGGPMDLTALCLSSSMDFTLKLWNFKDPVNMSKPLLKFERMHKFYVSDIQWSPVHPALFASTSYDGSLQLFNLNMNTECPVYTVFPSMWASSSNRGGSTTAASGLMSNGGGLVMDGGGSCCGGNSNISSGTSGPTVVGAPGQSSASTISAATSTNASSALPGGATSSSTAAASASATTSATIAAGTAGGVSSINGATRLRWSRNGQQIVIGTENGRVYLYDVHESLYNVRNSEWDEFASTIKDLSTIANSSVVSLSSPGGNYSNNPLVPSIDLSAFASNAASSAATMSSY